MIHQHSRKPPIIIQCREQSGSARFERIGSAVIADCKMIPRIGNELFPRLILTVHVCRHQAALLFLRNIKCRILHPDRIQNALPQILAKAHSGDFLDDCTQDICGNTVVPAAARRKQKRTFADSLRKLLRSHGIVCSETPDGILINRTGFLPGAGHVIRIYKAGCHVQKITDAHR